MIAQEQSHPLRVIWFGDARDIQQHLDAREVEIWLRDAPGLPEETDMYVLPDTQFSSVDSLLQTGKRLSFPILYLVREAWLEAVVDGLDEHDDVCFLEAPTALLSWRVTRLLAYIRAMGMHLERRRETSLGLSCRSFFETWVEPWLETLPPDAMASFAMVNIDDYKRVNEKHGYHHGDMVLQKFADMLREAVPDAPKITRWDGDKFLFVLPVGKDKAMAAAEKLRATVQQNPVTITTYCGIDHIVPLTVSIGVVTTPAAQASLTSVAQDADAACYDAKRKSGNRVCYRG